MPTLVIVNAKIKSDSVDAMKQLLAKILPETRKFDGNLGVTAYLNEDGQTCALVDSWESKPHYEKYLGWRQENGSLAEIVALLEGPPDIQYYEPVDA